MVIIFDLDDTLFPDISFVTSGFRVVAVYLNSILGMDVKEIEKKLYEELLVNRSEVFNRFLDTHGIHSKKMIQKCVSLYRGHWPDIQLYPEARSCLERLKKFPLYVLTDGNKAVQKRKFQALGLGKWIKKCVCTYAYGIKHSKPSSYCFEKICSWEKVSPSQVVYIADNPYKDFVGIKPLGFHTIRLLNGPYANIIIPKKYDAEKKINNLDELTLEFIQKMLN